MVPRILVLLLVIVHDTYFIQHLRVTRIQPLSLFKFKQRGLDIVHAHVLHTDVQGCLMTTWEKSGCGSVSGHRWV